MRRVREILRLKHECGATDRAIARSLSIARSTVALTLERVTATGLRWPLPATLTDRVLEAMLYAGHGSQQGARRKTEPDWAYVHHELRRPGVTLMLLWEEYRQRDPGGYRYSRWCELYRAWEGRLSPTMRQVHPAGERMFVDYAGQTIDLIDGRTGEIRAAQIFVAAMGASNYTYAEASWTQTLPDWIGAHVRALAFMGGVPAQLVPDNPKVGVDRANWYEPGLNRTYLGLAAHYGTAILPTRTRKPRDKAKVEAGVRFAQSYILGRLRHQTFFSLGEVNAAIAVVLGRINGHVMRRLGISRHDLFASIERPALKPLPETDYEFAEWRLARVGLDYHVEVQSFLYSVPHALIREQVDVRIAARTIEVFHRGRRVAAHQRRYSGRRHGTDPDHMPSAHRRYAEWTPERFRRWARSIGPSTEGLIVAVLANRPHPEQGFRTCLGVLRLFKGLDPARAESVSARAVEIGALNYKSIASILANKLDRRSRQTENATVIDHPNVRGPGYFN